MDPVERLLAIEEIKQLKARYFRFMDLKDWEGLRSLWAPDAVQDMSIGGSARTEEERAAAINHGPEAITAFMRRAVEHLETVHHGHMPEIEITSPTTATGIWALEDLLRYPPGARLEAMNGFGHYHETYEKVDGAWKIKTSTLLRLRRDEQPREGTEHA